MLGKDVLPSIGSLAVEDVRKVHVTRVFHMGHLHLKSSMESGLAGLL
jgi:hypothetical protein